MFKIGSSGVSNCDMSESDLYQRLLNSSFRFVSYRPRSQKEITDFLQKKLVKWKVAGPAALELVAARLKELGYIDDYKFAQWWVDQRLTHRPKGFRMIKSELERKGIEREVIETVLSHAAALESTLALQAVKKKLGLWDKLPPLEQKRKIYAFLGRRGFSGELIGRVIDELVGKE